MNEIIELLREFRSFYDNINRTLNLLVLSCLVLVLVIAPQLARM